MNRQSVVVFLTLAFLVYMVGRSPQKVELPEAQQLVAWGVLAILLGVLVDMDETAEIGDALTMLLLVAVLIKYGDGLFQWVNATVSPKPVQGSAAKERGGK